MIFDPPTVFGIISIVGTTGGLLLLFSWLQDRSVVALVLWGVAFILVSTGCVLAVTSHSVPMLLYVGPPLTLSAYGLMWCAARVFEGRRANYPLAFAGALGWLAALQVDGFADDIALRMRTASLMIAAYALMIASEFWRARDKELMSRWPAIVLMLLHAGCFVARTILIEILPFPAGTSTQAIPWFPVGALATLLHNFCLTFLVVNMVKERAELGQRRTALLDPLTGVANRRAFMDLGERSLRRAVAAGQPVALLLLDLDQFKQINDTFGHQTGDRVLCTFCDTATAALRPTDVFGRLGGEEFACLLPGASATEALAIAERIRSSFERRKASESMEHRASTVSVGVATTQDVGGDLTALMGAADRGLYQAKANGRNRVERATTLEPVASPSFAAA